MNDEQLLNEIVRSLQDGTTNITVGHLDRYDLLRSQLPRVNVAVDADFKRIYSGLFQVRYMAQPHRTIYFGMMEAEKRNAAHNFPTLLAAYQRQTARWEVSFISKLIAIINPNRPVWDRLVSARLGLALPLQRNQAACAAAYANLEARMQRLLGHQLFPNVIAAFAARFPARAYQPMRILDATIWGLG